MKFNNILPTLPALLLLATTTTTTTSSSALPKKRTIDRVPAHVIFYLDKHCTKSPFDVYIPIQLDPGLPGATAGGQYGAQSAKIVDYGSATVGSIQGQAMGEYVAMPDVSRCVSFVDGIEVNVGILAPPEKGWVGQ